MRERREPLAITRHHHLLQRPAEHLLPEPLHAVLLHGQHHGVVRDAEEHLHVPGHRVLRLDHRDAPWRLLDPGISEPHGLRVPKIGDAEELVLLRDADEAIAPEGAIGDVLLEALLAHGDVGFEEAGVEVVAVDGAVLDDADEGKVIGP